MSTQPQTNTNGGQKPARRKNQNPGFGAAKVSRADQGTFQEGVFTLPETSAPSTSAPSRNNNGTRRHNKPMSKSLESSSLLPSTTNHGASPSISSKAGRSAKSSSGKHLSFAPDAALVQIHHFPPTSPISYPPSSSHAEDSAASSAASKPSHWAGGAYANSPDPTSIPLPTFGPKPAAGMSVMPVATAPTPANFSAQASLDLRRLLNIPAPPLSIPLNATA